MCLCAAGSTSFEEAAIHPAGRIHGFNGQGLLLKKVSEDFLVDATHEVKNVESDHRTTVLQMWQHIFLFI